MTRHDLFALVLMITLCINAFSDLSRKHRIQENEKRLDEAIMHWEDHARSQYDVHGLTW